MSLISPASNSSASVALRLLIDAAARQSSPTTGTQLKSFTGTLNTASPTVASLSTGTKIVLSAKAASDYFGVGSDIVRAVADLGDTVEVHFSGLDVPKDKAAFSQQALDFLKSNAAGYDARHPEQAEFLQALKDGKVIVKTVDESPELKWQPNVGWAIYKDGYSQGGGITTGGTGDQALYENMGATRGQTIGQIAGHMFYAYYEK
jgi:hypothetical protein